MGLFLGILGVASSTLLKAEAAAVAQVFGVEVVPALDPDQVQVICDGEGAGTREGLTVCPSLPRW